MFETGNIVVCIPGGKRQGSGYKEGLVYKVSHCDWGNIAFGGVKTNGVYFESLRLATEEEISLYNNPKQNIEQYSIWN